MACDKHTACIGICIPNGTDNDGVSLLKAAIMATAEEQYRSAALYDGVGEDDMLHIDNDESEFIVIATVDPRDMVDGIKYPLYSMLQGVVVFK